MIRPDDAAGRDELLDLQKLMVVWGELLDSAGQHGPVFAESQSHHCVADGVQAGRESGADGVSGFGDEAAR